MLASWDRSFELYDDPRDVFAEPYAGKVAKLFDGTTPGDEMMATLPDSLDALLTPEGRELLENPHGNLRKALTQADAACDWAPAVPVRLYMAEDDEQALPANTASCLGSLEGDGATVVNLGTPEHFGSRHVGSNMAGTAAVLDWFLDRETVD
ncbi:MAG: hypothetical protein M3Q98_12675 [Actinomycetota bacterium]|nr:hypothetical protein [Actinomycetota bacterium]